MHFSDDDLRNVLRRKDPGADFTQRVMARISRQEEERALKPQKKRWRFPQLRWRPIPALAGAVAVLVLAIGIGLAYQHHQEEKAREAAEAKRAEQQMMLALRITNRKLAHVFRKVNAPAPPGPAKIRRQSL